MLGQKVAAATLAPFANASFGLLKVTNVLGALRDPHGIWFPQGEGIYRASRPDTARFAVAVTHRDGFARHGEFHSVAETPTNIGIFVSHDSLLPINRCSLGETNLIWQQGMNSKRSGLLDPHR